MRTLKFALAVALSGLAAAASAQSSGEARPAEPKVTPVMTRDLPEYPGKEALMTVVDYPPGGVSGIHRHDAHVFVYVIEGEVVMGIDGGQEVTIGPGQTFTEAPGDVHTVSRNASTTRPAKFIAFFLKDKRKPAVMPVE